MRKVRAAGSSAAPDTTKPPGCGHQAAPDTSAHGGVGRSHEPTGGGGLELSGRAGAALAADEMDEDELEGDVVEWRGSVDGGVIDVYVAIFRVGGLEGDIASAEVVVAVFEIQLAGGRA